MADIAELERQLQQPRVAGRTSSGRGQAVRGGFGTVWC